MSRVLIVRASRFNPRQEPAKESLGFSTNRGAVRPHYNRITTPKFFIPQLITAHASRFNPRQEPAEEWLGFGAYCFALPLLEFLEASDNNLLACTLAWDNASLSAPASAAGAAGAANTAGAAGVEAWDASADSAETALAASSYGRGCVSAEDAAIQATGALNRLQPPSSTSAYALQISRCAHSYNQS